MSSATQFRGVAPSAQNNWDIRAAGNFIGGGTGTGFLALAALAAFGWGLTWPLALIGLAFVGAGLFCVWLEIGRPWRALNVFLHPHTSWMTREATVAMPLFGLGLLAAWFNNPWLLLAAAAVGMGFLYCQSRMLEASKGIPAWREGMIVPLIFTTGLTEGAGLFLALAALTPAGLPLWAKPVFVMLLAARFLSWRIYSTRLARGGAPKKAVAAVRAAHPLIFWGGHVVPTLLLAVTPVMPATLATAAVATTGLLALAAGWYTKIVIILRAAYTQGFAIPHSPSRGAGTPGRGAAPGWE